MGEKTLRFIYCVELMAFLAAPAAWAQSTTPSPSATFTFTSSPSPTFTMYLTDTPTDSSTPTPTPTFTYNPYATPTWTFTWNPYATDTFTPGSPTATFTRTFTPTVTPTGTLIPTNTPSPTMTNTPGISRASLSLLSTAYTNAWDRTDGFDWDMAFTYYIGSIISRDYSKPDIDSLEPSRFALLTSDVKYAWLKDENDQPAIASGVMMSFLAQLAAGNSGTGTGTQAFSAGSTPTSSGQIGTNVLGAVYTVISKTVAPNTAVHFGYIYGLKQLDEKVNFGFFTMNYSQLLPLLTTKLQGLTEDPPGIFYTGFSTRFWGRNWKFEIWKPIPMDQNPILLNTQIEGLPLAFNLGFEKWGLGGPLYPGGPPAPGGWAMLGYVNFKFTILPQVPSY